MWVIFSVPERNFLVSIDFHFTLNFYFHFCETDKASSNRSVCLKYIALARIVAQQNNHTQHVAIPKLKHNPTRYSHPTPECNYSCLKDVFVE